MPKARQATRTADSVQDLDLSPAKATRSKTKAEPAAKVQKKTASKTVTKRKKADPKPASETTTKSAKIRSIELKLDDSSTPALSPGGSTIVASTPPHILNGVRPLEKITEKDILSADSPAKLALLVSSLVSTQQDSIFERYRQTTRLQQSNDAKLISELRSELSAKQKTIEGLIVQIQNFQESGDVSVLSSAPAVSSTPQKGRRVEMYESPIRKRSESSLMIRQDDLANELKTIGITLDMLELLTGVRIINYEEDLDRFYFDVKQTSTNMEDEAAAVSVEYKLVIKRKFEQTAEVTYVPVFLRTDKKSKGAELDRRSDNANKVAKHLPEYLQDNLIFPYNTLLQFYTKMSKALNKSTKT